MVQMLKKLWWDRVEQIFLSKMSIASKEARETNYWLRLIRDSETLASPEVDPLLTESESIANILTSIVKTTGINNSKLKTQNSKSAKP